MEGAGSRPRSRSSTGSPACLWTRLNKPKTPDAVDAGPLRLSDARLGSLRLAADAWRRSTSPKRQAVDQVCLVPDVAAFMEAIALWDFGHFFPILIDEPAWTLPFLRAYRPARVVRFTGTARQKNAASPSGPPAGEDTLWTAIARTPCASLVWSGPAGIVGSGGAIARRLTSASRRLAWFSPTPRPRCSPEPSRWPPDDFSRCYGFTR